MAMRLGETPVPVPNTMVKTQAADDTIPETVWESRWLPDNTRGCSSVGRAPALQAGGHEFESHHLHLYLENFIQRSDTESEAETPLHKEGGSAEEDVS